MKYTLIGFAALALAFVGVLLLLVGIDREGWLLVALGALLGPIAFIRDARSREAKAQLRIVSGNTSDFNRIESRIPEDRWGIPGSSTITGAYVKVVKVENRSDVEARRVRVEIIDGRPSDRVTAFPVRLEWLDNHAEERDIPPRGWALVPIQSYVMTNEKQYMLGHTFLWHLGTVEFTLVAWGENASADRRSYRLDWPEAGPHRSITELPEPSRSRLPWRHIRRAW